MYVFVEMKRRYSLKCLKIDIDVLCTLDCYLVKLLSKKILNLYKLTFALPQDVKSSHVDSTKILSSEIEMNLRLRQAVACIYLFLTQVINLWFHWGKVLKKKSKPIFSKSYHIWKPEKKEEFLFITFPFKFNHFCKLWLC